MPPASAPMFGVDVGPPEPFESLAKVDDEFVDGGIGLGVTATLFADQLQQTKCLFELIGALGTLAAPTLTTWHTSVWDGFKFLSPAADLVESCGVELARSLREVELAATLGSASAAALS